MVGWELAKYNPYGEPFANAGWRKYEHDGREITNLYINNSVGHLQAQGRSARLR